MRDSERYLAQAEAVLRMAAKAASPAEKDVYLNIAAGWRQLATEAKRHETPPGEGCRSFDPKTKDED
jgi:hypothetical protein